MQLPTTTELLLAWDAARERSQQTEIGMSALGDCQRRTGYRLAKTDPDPEYKSEKIQAVMGSAIHQAAAFGSALLIPGAHAETLEVDYCGLTGHPDLYISGVVRDIKTIGYKMQLDRIRQDGARLRDRWQAHTYGAGLIKRGYPVHTVEIDYLCRDSGEEYLFSEPWSIDQVEAAMKWLQTVRESAIETLNRDYRPDSAVCQSCEFFRRCWDAEPGRSPLSVLYTENPDARYWAEKLEDATERAERAKDDADDARGALDALRTVSSPGEHQELDAGVPGKRVRYTVKRGRRSFDKAKIAMDYKRAGARPPEIRGEPTIDIRVVKNHDAVPEEAVPEQAGSEDRADAHPPQAHPQGQG